MCKYNNILNGHHDGEKTDYENWYNNDRIYGTTLTELKRWLKILVKKTFVVELYPDYSS